MCTEVEIATGLVAGDREKDWNKKIKNSIPRLFTKSSSGSISITSKMDKVYETNIE
jgi:hypothetical protein